MAFGSLIERCISFILNERSNSTSDENAVNLASSQKQMSSETIVRIVGKEEEHSNVEGAESGTAKNQRELLQDVTKEEGDFASEEKKKIRARRFGLLSPQSPKLDMSLAAIIRKTGLAGRQGAQNDKSRSRRRQKRNRSRPSKRDRALNGRQLKREDSFGNRFFNRRNENRAVRHHCGQEKKDLSVIGGIKKMEKNGKFKKKKKYHNGRRRGKGQERRARKVSPLEKKDHVERRPFRRSIETRGGRHRHGRQVQDLRMLLTIGKSEVRAGRERKTNNRNRYRGSKENSRRAKMEEVGNGKQMGEMDFLKRPFFPHRNDRKGHRLTRRTGIQEIRSSRGSVESGRSRGVKRS